MLQAPGNLVHTKAMRRLIQRILQSHSIRRIAGFQSSKFLSEHTFSLTDASRVQAHLRRLLPSFTAI
jgi:hypothetical protein